MVLRRRSTLSGLLDRLKHKRIIKRSLKKSASCEALLPPPAPRSPSFSVVAVYTCAMLLDAHTSDPPKDPPVSGHLYLANTLIVFQSAEKRVLRARLCLQDIVAVKPALFMHTDNAVSVFGTSGVLKFVLVQHRDELLATLNGLVAVATKQDDKAKEGGEKRMLLIGQFGCAPRDLVSSLCKMNARFDGQSRPDYHTFRMGKEDGIIDGVIEFRDGKSLVWMTKAIDALRLQAEDSQSELSLTLLAASPPVLVALRQYLEFVLELVQFILLPYAKVTLLEQDYGWRLGCAVAAVLLCAALAMTWDAAVTVDRVHHAQRKAAIEQAKLEGLVRAYKKMLTRFIGP